MDRKIFLSMGGAKAAMQRQEVLSGNLSNVSTVGFRAEMQAFRAVPVRGGEGSTTRAYTLETTTGYNPQPGPVQATGRNLDVAMQGGAWLALQALDGTEAYTRAGSLHVGTDGTLVNPSGLPVLGDGGPISVPANAQVQIASDGTVSAQVGNARPTPLGKLKMVTPQDKLQRGDDGLFRSANGELPADPAARLQDGALEGSNVSAVETMVQMISAARQFEMQMRSMQTAEKDEQTAAQLLSLN